MQQSLSSMRATIAPKAGAAELQRAQPAGTCLSIMFSSVSTLAGKPTAVQPCVHVSWCCAAMQLFVIPVGRPRACCCCRLLWACQLLRSQRSHRCNCQLQCSARLARRSCAVGSLELHRCAGCCSSTCFCGTCHPVSDPPTLHASTASGRAHPALCPAKFAPVQAWQPRSIAPQPLRLQRWAWWVQQPAWPCWSTWWPAGPQACLAGPVRCTGACCCAASSDRLLSSTACWQTLQMCQR